jgi:short subunit dehydrogenase-like uncharacterized protein
MVEGAAHGTRVRRGGELLELDDPPRTTVDFGNGPQPAIGLSWGDVASAWRSTRIPNIEVYFEASPQLKRSSAMPPLMKAVVRTRFGQWLAKNRIDRRMPPGPDRDVRSKARTIVVADAWDDAGSHALSRLETMEPYSLTALTAVDITDRVASGAVSPGYQTPATAFGPDFILGYPATTRVDLSVSA